MAFGIARQTAFKSRLLTGLALSALLSTAAIAAAPVAGSDETPLEGANLDAMAAKPDAATALRTAIEAQVQADVARAQGNASALAAAAEKFAGAGSFATLSAKPAETGGVEDEAPKAATAPADAAALMSEAQALAANDADLSAALAAKAGAVSRTFGAVGGPGTNTTRIRGGATHTYDTRFRKGELAEVGIDGDNDSDLDLYVIDQNGNIICRSESYGDAEYCSWYPRWTGPFRIAIINRGRSSNVYWIATN